MKKKVIIHSHFYQPPRENPVTLKIEKETSAFPFNNWNERITEECYRANAFSRYLNPKAKIEAIINNYEYMSFNFGPTLFEYIKNNYPEVKDKILEGDKKSIKRLGCGNAIAQCFNHTILPLDDEFFAECQIRWGLDYFQGIFNRKSKGMWMPECAISPFVIDLLSKYGIEFVLLSPYQIEYIELDNKIIYPKDFTDELLANVFYIKGNNSKIKVLFYHKTLSSDISFNHLLRSANNFLNRIKDIAQDNVKLVFAATDGEIYGHHEPFGDMAFAALSKKISLEPDLEFTNPETFIKENKSLGIAHLKQGEDKKGSSWSCAHGVERWYKDCGCTTGSQDGWNQRWRTPLRDALNNAKQDLYKTIFKSLKNKGYNPEEVLLNRISKPVELKEVEAFKWMSYSFTSCGWFFADISGLESEHNIAYMLKALDLMELDKTKENFINHLDKAKSNIKGKGTGKDSALRIITYSNNQDIYKILSDIKNNGLNSHNIEVLLSYISFLNLSPRDKEYFSAQNTVYEALLNSNYKSKALDELKNVLNLN